MKRDVLPTPPSESGVALLSRTAYGIVGFQTWVRWSDIPDGRVPVVEVKFEHLRYLQSRIRLLRDEEAATEARALLAELAEDDSWLVGYLVLRAMYTDYLFDPNVLATLEEHPEHFIRERTEGARTFRKAHNLPPDRTIPLSESRMLN